MKRSLLLVVVVAALVGCPMQMSDWDGSGLPPGASGALLPSDQVRDVARSMTGPFTFETLYPVSLTLAVNLYDTDSRGYVVGDPLPAGSAVVIVKLEDVDGNHIYSGQVSADGTFDGVVQVRAEAEDARLTISAENFEKRTIILRDLANYSRIDRTLSLQRIVVVDGRFVSRAPGDPIDTDGDGVPDDEDAYPEDANAAFRLNVPADGRITIAFEDLFGRANAGDADYNDFIAAYAIVEVLNAANEVVWIEVDAEAITKLAGYDHTFGIRIDSFARSASLSRTLMTDSGDTVTVTSTVAAPAEIVLFENSRNDVGKTASFRLTFDEPQTHTAREPAIGLSEAPYNPYVIVHDTGHDIHLIEREWLTDSINPGDDFVDDDYFPWALLVPIDWIHPDEGQRIEVHYPRFEDWRLSEGTEHADWYNHYDDPWDGSDDGPDAYVAGFYNNGGVPTAAYWFVPGDGSDPVPTDLAIPAGGSSAFANDIFLVGDSKFVAGYYVRDSKNAAVFWEDGVPHDLVAVAPGDSDASLWNSIATGIYVDVDPDTGDRTVLVSGYLELDTERIPFYWENGTPVLLQTAASASAEEIGVLDETVLVPGHAYGSTTQPPAATLWSAVSGVSTPNDLSAGEITEAFDIDIDPAPAGQVYVAGSFLDSSGGNFASVYWTIDPVTFASTMTGLYNVAGSWSKAYGIDEESGEIYTAGYYAVGTDDVPAYWIGSEIHPLAGPSGRALDIDAESGVVFVAGHAGGEAILWRNGEAVAVSGPGVAGSANSVVALVAVP